jgi:hypothetical protein
MFIILAGVGASWVRALPSAWAGDSLLSPAFRGEACSPALRRRRTSATRGRLAAGWCSVSGPLGWMALVPPPTLPPAVWPGRGCPSTARATVAPCVGPPHPRLLLPAGRTGGPYKTPYAAGVAATFLDGLVLTLVGGRERGPLRAC